MLGGSFVQGQGQRVPRWEEKKLKPSLQRSKMTNIHSSLEKQHIFSLITNGNEILSFAEELSCQAINLRKEVARARDFQSFKRSKTIFDVAGLPL